MYAFAISMSMCVDVMERSSVYVVNFTGACGVSYRYVIERRIVEQQF